jgi:hypothetical protein
MGPSPVLLLAVKFAVRPAFAGRVLLMRATLFLFGVAVLALNASFNARADEWPPLRAREERRSQTVRVGNTDFWSGFYSYEVPRYHVDALHIKKSVNLQSRSWRGAFGPGEPDFMRDETGPPSKEPLAPLPSLPSLPALPPLPAVPQQPLAPLPNLPPLAALPPLPR